MQGISAEQVGTVACRVPAPQGAGGAPASHLALLPAEAAPVAPLQTRGVDAPSSSDPGDLDLLSSRTPSLHRWDTCPQHAPRPGHLTTHAEHHADRGLPDGVPGHAFVAACVGGPHVVDGQEPLGADVEFPTFCHLHPILEQNGAGTVGTNKTKQQSPVFEGLGPHVSRLMGGNTEEAELPSTQNRQGET